MAIAWKRLSAVVRRLPYEGVICGLPLDWLSFQCKLSASLPAYDADGQPDAQLVCFGSSHIRVRPELSSSIGLRL